MKLAIIFSDIEVGAGNVTDDFVEDDLLVDTIKSHFEEAVRYPSDLIFNGDTIDFMKCPYKGKYPKHITASVSVYKLESVVKAHQKFFQIMTDWLEINEHNRVIFVVGNHDYDLVFPKVQDKLKEIIANGNSQLKKRIIINGFEWSEGLLHVEHGNQLDNFFKVDPKNFIYYHPDHFIKEPFLLLPWGYNAVYDHYIHLKEEYPLLERIIPRTFLLKYLSPRLKRRIIYDTAIYMLRSFFWTQFKFWSDPLHRFTPKEFYKYVKKFLKNDYELRFVDQAKRKLKKSKYRVFAIGHNHRKSEYKLDDGKIILNTSCWRDEYESGKDETTFYPKMKTYGYVLHTPKKIEQARIVEVVSRQKPLTIKDVQKMVAD